MKLDTEKHSKDFLRDTLPNQKSSKINTFKNLWVCQIEAYPFFYIKGVKERVHVDYPFILLIISTTESFLVYFALKIISLTIKFSII